jgi:aminoglycoside N3'-acetyltransferase
MPEIPFEAELLNADGTKIPTSEKFRVANIARLLPHVEKALREKNAVKEFSFGSARCLLLECREVFEIVTELVRKNPSYL